MSLAVVFQLSCAACKRIKGSINKLTSNAGDIHILDSLNVSTYLRNVFFEKFLCGGQDYLKSTNPIHTKCIPLI